MAQSTKKLILDGYWQELTEEQIQLLFHEIFGWLPNP
jgi:hypothetical protein